MVAPLPKVGLLSVNLGTLVEDVEKIKITLDPAQQGLAQVLTTQTTKIETKLDTTSFSITQDVGVLKTKVTKIDTKLDTSIHALSALKHQVTGIEQQFDHLAAGKIKEAAVVGLVNSHNMGNTPVERQVVVEILNDEFAGDIDKLAKTSKSDLSEILNKGYQKHKVAAFKVPPESNITAFLADVSIVRKF